MQPRDIRILSGKSAVVAVQQHQKSHDLGSVCYRPRHRMAKRKRAALVQPDPNHTASTLKEYIWNELLLILRSHSYVPLRGKQTSDKAMGNFQ
jgi:hypothetical protein